MKNLLKLRFLLGGLMVMVIALIVVNQSWAEDVPVDKMAQMEAQLKNLLDFKQKVENYNPGLQTIDDFKDNDQEPQQAGGDGTKFPPQYNCTLDHLEWPSSDTYKESEWAMEDMYASSSNGSATYFSDINGDGLVDYYFINNTTTERRTCVDLNNGRGWDLVHKCYAEKIQGVWTFYGDCAK